MKKYLIWSSEHRGWWLPSKMGYTFTRDRAGRFSLEEALEIVIPANFYDKIDAVPNEMIVPDDYEQ